MNNVSGKDLESIDKTGLILGFSIGTLGIIFAMALLLYLREANVNSLSDYLKSAFNDVFAPIDPTR